MAGLEDYLRRLLRELDEKIALEELRVAQAKAAAGGRWYKERLGEIKRLYNLIEERQIVFLKSIFPDRTFYAQAKLVALELPNGKVILLKTGQKLPVLELADGTFIPEPKPGQPLPKGAKPVVLSKGRIWDIVEVSGDEVLPHELKTKKAIVDSAGRAGDVEAASFKSSTTLGKQIRVESVLQKIVRVLNAKTIVLCEDPINGATVRLKIAPDKFHVSRVMTYEQIPDRLAKQTTGFVGRTIAKAKSGSIHLESTGMSQPIATAKPGSQSTIDQGRAPKFSQQGPVETGSSGSKGTANRLVMPKGLSAGARLVGGVNLALAPVQVFEMARVISGEAEAQQEAEGVAAGLNPDDYEVGQEFKHQHGLYDYHIRVEEVLEFPYNLKGVRKKLPGFPRKKGKKVFLFLGKTPAIM